MSPDTGYEERLRAARAAIRSGESREARRLLSALIREDPSDYRTWLWMAGLTSSPRASLEYIARAESLRPGDRHVARARAWAKQREAAARASVAVASMGTGRRRARRPLLALLLVVVIGAGLLGAWRYVPAVRAAVSGALGDGVPAWGRETSPAALAQATGAPTSPPMAQATLQPTIPPTELPPTPVASSTPSPTVQPTSTELPRTAPALSAKPVGAHADSRPTWTATPPPTPTPTETPVPTPTTEPTATPEPATSTVVGTIPIGADEPWIDVNLSTQSLTAYRGNQPVFSTLVSSGMWQFPTVTGQFRIYLRFEAQDMSGYHLGYNYYLPSVPYVMYFYEDYALHGAYWHNNFGTPMSHGCVNLSPDDAAWLYDFAGLGTLVNVHY